MCCCSGHSAVWAGHCRTFISFRTQSFNPCKRFVNSFSLRSPDEKTKTTQSAVISGNVAQLAS
jgi:hypothetical protein